jgi:hypothetical protein
MGRPCLMCKKTDLEMKIYGQEAPKKKTLNFFVFNFQNLYSINFNINI